LFKRRYRRSREKLQTNQARKSFVTQFQHKFNLDSLYYHQVIYIDRYQIDSYQVSNTCQNASH